jgi:dTDP-4-amino-4,6-dideoxygalactose transaminase
MNIPFVDLKAQYISIKKDIDTAIENVLTETAFIGGKYVNQFEKDFENLYGVNHCISCANGTDSLYIIMKMLGIGFGDEVITVANSWISSSETISQTGATPVFVDIDEEYFSINENLIEEKITPKTKALIIVHLHGQMCNMVEIERICTTHNLHLIEDCAQSHLSEYNNIRAGLRGIAASFSFYPGKNLGAYGDAGCIITNNQALAEKCKMYARHGALIKHQHKIEGINSRLDGLQAAVLSAKLPYLIEWTEKRIKAATCYDNALKNIPEIVTPKVRKNSKHTFHLYVIRAKRRDELINYLKDNGIETAIHYPTPLPMLEAYQYLNYKASDFPIANQYKNEILSLPLYPEITSEQINYIASIIKSFYQK